MCIVVLRIGHRYIRDFRVTTHVALVARAFGAEKMLVVNPEADIRKTIEKVSRKWGGNFLVEEKNDWRKLIQEWKDGGGKVVHLTMYGINVDNVIKKIKEEKDLMIVIGAEKVPREVYEMSNYNIAIGNQPHSEIAALAVFLDRIYGGKQLRHDFNGTIKIIPSRRQKLVRKAENRRS